MQNSPLTPSHRAGFSRTRLAVALCVGGLLAVAAFAATYTKQNARVPRLQIQTEFVGNTGTAAKVRCDVWVESILINDANGTDVLPGQLRVVTFDLLDPALTNTNITAAGETVTYPKLAALLRQAALDRASAQGIQ